MRLKITWRIHVGFAFHWLCPNSTRAHGNAARVSIPALLDFALRDRSGPQTMYGHNCPGREKTFYTSSTYMYTHSEAVKYSGRRKIRLLHGVKCKCAYSFPRIWRIFSVWLMPSIALGREGLQTRKEALIYSTCTMVVWSACLSFVCLQALWQVFVLSTAACEDNRQYYHCRGR